MTEGEFAKLIESARATKVLAELEKLAPPERRRFAKTAIRLFRRWEDAAFSFDKAKRKTAGIRDADAVRIAALACCVPSELDRFSFRVIPEKPSLIDVFSALRPDWTDRWVAAMVAESPYFVHRVAPLWAAGLCARPTSDAFILSYYAHHQSTEDLADSPEFLDHDVWRFFDVEGGGEFSLASHDKYCSPDGTWSKVLVDLSAAGKLDRGRLLDASLDALERDFGQFRAGWYARFHTALDPTIAEMTTRRDVYLRLLGSTVPPTVSFALKTLKALDKAGALPAADVVAHLAPAIQAQQKSTITAALQLVASAARKAPDKAPALARMATAGLIAEAAEVQGKVLDLVEKLGGAEDAQTCAALAEYRDAVTPSVRARLEAMAGLDPAPVNKAAVAPASVAVAEPIAPCVGSDEALALFLEVLESPRDPFAVEKAMDGMARHGAALVADPQKLSPLAKRAKQVFENPGDSRIRRCLAAAGRALCEGGDPGALLGDEDLWRRGFARVFFDRNVDVLRQIAAGASLPMLSAPSDTSGQVLPGDLLERLNTYRAAGLAPGATDLNLALLRLGHEERGETCAKLEGTGEVERAFRYGLGADETPDGNAALWTAAWAARNPRAHDPRVAALAGARLPHCGIPAEMTLKVWKEGDGPYYWVRVDLHEEPPPGAVPPELLSGLFHTPQRHRWHTDNPCGYVYPDVAWASLVWPTHPDPFCARGALAMDTDQKLTDHPCIAYLEALLRPDVVLGSMGYAMLAHHMASTDKSVGAMAVEVLIEQIGRGALDPDRMASAVRPFLLCGVLPSARWTRHFTAAAAFGPRFAAWVRQVIEKLLSFPPQEAPRDLGGMVELLFELHVAADSAPEELCALSFLADVTAGGKLGQFSKKLLKRVG